MNYLRIKTTEVKGIVRATFPDYRKREVIIHPTEKMSLNDLNWSGGTRSEYRACSIDGGPLKNQYNMSAPAPWDNPFEGKEINIPQGFVVVEGGYFCGKPKTLYIYVNPSDMPKYLNSPN